MTHRWAVRSGIQASTATARNGRSTLLQMRLQQTKPLKRQLPGFLRESGQLLHASILRQLMLTDLRHLILKVTVKGVTLQNIWRRSLHAIWRG